MKSTTKRKVGAIATGVAAVTSLGLGASTALAATSVVSGNLNPNGALVQYATYRTKQGYGSIGLNVTNMPSGYLRLGLINANHVQFSDSIQWNTKGYKSWSGVYSGTRFALQGRMASGGTDTYWSGVLTY